MAEAQTAMTRAVVFVLIPAHGLQVPEGVHAPACSTARTLPKACQAQMSSTRQVAQPDVVGLACCALCFAR
eukprot:4875628-Lingulodinium_polyedra.AAC.1